jgi:hypothetical protein
MEFHVKTKDSTVVKLDRFQLLDILLAEVLETQKDEFIALSNGLTHYLQQRSTLSQLTIDQLVTTCVALGNYFRVFMENNEVTIISGENENELVNQNSDEPARETSSS